MCQLKLYFKSLCGTNITTSLQRNRLKSSEVEALDKEQNYRNTVCWLPQPSNIGGCRTAPRMSEWHLGKVATTPDPQQRSPKMQSDHRRETGTHLQSRNRVASATRQMFAHPKFN